MEQFRAGQATIGQVWSIIGTMPQSELIPALQDVRTEWLTTVAEFEDAEEFFRKAITHDPRLLEAHINLGLTLRAAGKREAARAAYQEALQLDPSNQAARNGLDKLGQE